MTSRSHRRRSFRPSLAALAVFGMGRIGLAHPSAYVLVNVEMKWGTDGLERDCKLMVRLTGRQVATDQLQRVIVDVMNRSGGYATAGQDLLTIDYDAPSDTQINPPAVYYVPGGFTTDPNGAEKLRVRAWEFGNFEGEPTRTLSLEIPPYCPDIQTESQLTTLVDCGSCELSIGVLPADSVKVFKTVRAGAQRPTIYALHPDDESEATWGETVSGRFRAPKCGVLQFQVTGTSGDSGDKALVYREGWDGDGTLASSGVKYVKKLAKDEVYKFSIRGVRGTHEPVTLLLDFFTWRDGQVPLEDREDCLQQLQYKVGGVAGLTLNIEELRYKKVPLAPGQPPPVTGSKHTETVAGATTTWYEIEIPGCGPSQENMTERFVLPIHADGKVTNGHALGWRKQGTAVFAPDPEGDKYEIPGF